MEFYIGKTIDRRLKESKSFTLVMGNSVSKKMTQLSNFVYKYEHSSGIT